MIHRDYKYTFYVTLTLQPVFRGSEFRPDILLFDFILGLTGVKFRVECLGLWSGSPTYLSFPGYEVGSREELSNTSELELHTKRGGTLA